MLVSGTAVLVAGPAPTAAAAPALTFQLKWTAGPFNDPGNPIALSSPVVATLDSGGPAAVVGDRAGNLYAYHLSNGTPVAGSWPYRDGGIPIDSSPSTSGSSVFIGEGNAATYEAGGYVGLNANGTRRWLTPIALFPPPNPSPDAAVASGLTVGTLQGSTSVVSGSLGQQQDELDARTGAVRPGFPWLATDSNFTTPAVADLYGDGQNEIIEGGDQAGNPATHRTQGGHLRILRQTGNAGTGDPSGGLVCDFITNQVVQSSPAVGTFLGGGAVGIAFGTGTFFAGASETDQLLAVDSHCRSQWAATLDGSTTGSPALVGALGNGLLQVAEGTQRSDNSGSVYLLNGSNGSTIWRARTAFPLIGSVTSADFGEGYQDILAPTTGGLVILDGRTGQQVATVETNILLQNSVLVTDDPNGTIGLTVAGYTGLNVGEIAHYELAGSSGAKVNEGGAWPEFHHDPQLTGNAGTPPPPHCTPPTGGPAGYLLAASDGGVFPFGNLPYCGSTGNIVLNRPIVSAAGTKDGGGYWLVASDGGVFTFGDAGYHGSTGNIRLNQPIVGMAPTSDSKGYWLVAADGGIFTFGDAGYYGSTGNVRLNQPIVGMAASPGGHGYWLVARDGGVFAFGDAKYAGSTGNIQLNQPIVGMAAVPGGSGYWLVAADGGIFTFGGAPYEGSTGNVRLNQPIIGMAAAPSSKGYWLAAADGGIFTFGQARFYGSAGGLNLNRPIVAISGQ